MAKRGRTGREPRSAGRNAPTSPVGPTRRSGRRGGRTGQPSDGPDEPVALTALAGSRRRLAIAVGGSGLVAFLLYLRTLAPTIVGGDSGELIAAGHVLGVAHPPGYPTFTLLAHAAGSLPVGSPAFGMNLLSAVLDATAVGLAVAVGLSLVGRFAPDPGGTVTAATPTAVGAKAVTTPVQDRVPLLLGAVAGAGLLAISSTFWSYSLVTEVFPLNNLLAVATVGLMIRWEGRPSRPGPLWLAALLSGLALTNQQTIVLFAPGLLILYAAGLRRLLGDPSGGAAGGAANGASPARLLMRFVAVPIALLVAGLVPYLYLPLAASGDPAVDWGDPRTLGRFLSVVSRQSYGTLSLTVRDTSGGILDQLMLLGGAVVGALTPVGIVLAGLGWWAVARASATIGIALAALVLVSGPLFVAIANPPLDDPVTRGVLERFYLLPTIVVAILAGVGVTAATLRAVRLVAPERRRAVVPIVAAVVGVSLVALTAGRMAAVDQSGNRVAEAYGRDILEPLPPDAILLTRSDENYTSVLFAQVVDRIRPDVVAIDVELLKLPTTVEQLRRRHPEIEIPFGSYDDGVNAKLGDLVAANLPARPVLVAGKLKEDLATRFDIIPWGLARRFLPPGTGPAPDQAARDDAARFASLHPPGRAWPDTTWEGAIAADYASAAFEDAHARQQPGAMPDAAEIADLYRLALRLAPSLASADKNLGLLLRDNGGDNAEIVAVWRRFLDLEPDDPDAGAIRTELARLSGTP